MLQTLLNNSLVILLVIYTLFFIVSALKATKISKVKLGSYDTSVTGYAVLISSNKKRLTENYDFTVRGSYER